MMFQRYSREKYKSRGPISSLFGAFKCHQGFTLLEVMISMSIVAVTASSLSVAMSGVLTSSARLEEKTMAHVLAMNKMAELLAQPDWPSLGKRDEFVEMSRREWVVTAEVKNSALPKLRQIEVRVGLRADGLNEDPAMIHRLRSLVSQHFLEGGTN
jgi:general secretion pathway protein I